MRAKNKKPLIEMKYLYPKKLLPSCNKNLLRGGAKKY